MKSEQWIIHRINELTGKIGDIQNELYDIVLDPGQRKCIYSIQDLSKKMTKYYTEIKILEEILKPEGEINGADERTASSV
jgi:hypothetical protein